MFKHENYTFVDDEKSKISGKNGSLLPHLPTLEAEPDKQETADKDKKENPIESDNKCNDLEKGKNEKSDKIEENSIEPEPKWVETLDGQIEIEDPDDYLIYLEDILKRIHE